MTGTSVQNRYAEALMNTFGPPRLTLVRGEGARVWDDAGREYLDLFGGIAVNALGHGHPALVGAVTSQLRTLGHVSNFFATEPQVALAERLLRMLAPTGGEGRVFFANSGAEANEAALKLTRRTGRTHLVAAEGSFHGRTMGALALTHKPSFREPFEPLPGEVTWVPYGDADALAAAVTDETAAVVLEPIQGEAGVVVPPDDYLTQARRVATEHGALLWLDEVQTGVGRTGEWFAHAASVRPDVITLAKGLGGGIPIGACVGLADAGSLLGPGHHGSTFGGNPVACAAALAVLDTIEKESLLEAARERGAQLAGALASAEPVIDVTGRGLLVGAQLAHSSAPDIVSRAQGAGFLLNNTSPDRLRFAPPLTITERDLALFADAWRDLAEGPELEEQS
jgi:acetylornithine/N-succinyldiaminopimelate aminotransferase